MKKSTMLLGTGLLIATILTGCAQTTKQKEEALQSDTDAIFKAVQNSDSADMMGYLLGVGVTVDTEDSAEATTEAIMEDSTEAAVEAEGSNGLYQYFCDYLTDCAKKMTYEIKSVDAENLTVDVSCTYVDSTKMVTNLSGDLILAAFDHLDGSKMTGEEIKSVIDKAVDDVGKEKTKTVEYTLQYEENDGNYVLKDTPDELSDSATAGLYSILDKVTALFGDIDLGGDEEETDDPLASYADQITYKLDKGLAGTLITVSNPTDQDLQIFADIFVKDKDGNELFETGGVIPYAAAGSDNFICFGHYNDNLETVDYDSVDIQISTGTPHYNDGSANVSLKEAKGDDGINVTITNNNDFTCDNVYAIALYYKDGKFIGYDQQYGDTLDAGKSCDVTMTAPYDENDKVTDYDDYKLYAYAFQFVE